MVKLLLEFRARLDTCVSRALQGNPMFSQALKEAFEHFINQVLKALPADARKGCRPYDGLVALQQQTQQQQGFRTAGVCSGPTSRPS